MGIEQNKGGAWIPDKETKWPNLKEEERSKVYASHKEKYAGKLSNLKHEIEDDSRDFWEEMLYGFNDDDHDFSSTFEASDPKLSGMPVSGALLSVFKREANNESADMTSKGSIKGKEKDLMFYCLDFIQNSPKNIALRNSDYPKGSIDKVPKDGFINIYINDKGYWMLNIEDKDHNILSAAYLFPED